MPEMTGDTANGRSISVVSRFLPRKSNLAIAQPAQTPNTRFNGTAIAAASSVSFSAAIASGCVIASTYAPQPLRERFGEDERQRQDQEERQEREHDRRERPAEPDRLRQVIGRVAARDEWSGRGPAMTQFARCRPLQCWSALIASSSRNEVVSMTSAIAVAPA